MYDCRRGVLFPPGRSDAQDTPLILRLPAEFLAPPARRGFTVSSDFSLAELPPANILGISSCPVHHAERAAGHRGRPAQRNGSVLTKDDIHEEAPRLPRRF